MTAEEYLSRVDWALRDLPWRVRRELASELERHLAELPADTALLGRLGRPEQYAAEMRSAAGLERRRGVIAFLRARRPRNLVLAAILLTVIGLTIGAIAWIDSYQPLAFDMAMQNPIGAVEAPGGGRESVVFHEGRRFELGIDVKNAGSFTVRVLGVPLRSDLFSARLVMSGSANANFAGLAPPFTRFHAFDLKPGQARSLVLQGVYHARCLSWKSGGSELLTDFPVRFSFLWRTATAQLPLPEDLAIVVPKGGGGSCR